MTQTVRTDCKGCSATVRVSPEEADAAFARLRLPKGTPPGNRNGLCA